MSIPMLRPSNRAVTIDRTMVKTMYGQYLRRPGPITRSRYSREGEEEGEKVQPSEPSSEKLTREEIASLYRQAVSDAPSDEPEADTQSRQETETRAEPQLTEALSKLEGQDEPVPDNPQTESQGPSPSEPKTPNASTEPVGSELTGLPQAHSLPPSIQRELPSINYQEHHYGPGGESWVRLNRERMRAGDRLTQDLRIESIDEEGLVLNYRGRSFRLKALNSWINM